MIAFIRSRPLYPISRDHPWIATSPKTLARASHSRVHNDAAHVIMHRRGIMRSMYQNEVRRKFAMRSKLSAFTLEGGGAMGFEESPSGGSAVDGAS